MYSYKSKVVIRNQKRNWEKRNRQNWKKIEEKTKCKNHKRLMQILVSYEFFYKPMYRGRGRTVAADRTRTYDLNSRDKKLASYQFFFWLLAWFMCLNKYVRSNHSHRPLIPDLRTRRWFSDYEKVHFVWPSLTCWPMKLMPLAWLNPNRITSGKLT